MDDPQECRQVSMNYVGAAVNLGIKNNDNLKQGREVFAKVC